MKSSNLAQRLEEFENDIRSLNLTEAPASRRQVVREILEPRKPVRRATRIGGIQLREQGLRSFRVC